ncbi:hypothetical protein [Actinoallomurus sp. NPDC050550]|uniref:hypothetical protein n=1 Tax=Actinoallomurus sp. NPDC050550 TaxID=3154937 RepID=UPI0033EBD3C7
MSGSRTYTIKTGAQPAGNPANYNYVRIKTLIEATNHEKVSAAGVAFNNAAKIVAMAAHELYLVGTKLSEKWEGADADAAQKALGQLYATANELFGRSQQTGYALQTYGAALKQFKSLQWPQWPADDSPVQDQQRQRAAEKVMQAVNKQIAAAWSSMPEKVQQNLPILDDKHRGTPYSSGAPSPGVGGPGGGGRAPRGVTLPHSSHSPGLPNLSHGGGDGLPISRGSGHGTDLAGLPSTGGGLGAPPPSTGGPLPSGSPGGIPSLPGGGLPSGGDNGPSLYPGPGSMPQTGSGSSRVPLEEPSSSGVTNDEAATFRTAAMEEAEASQAARNGLMVTPGAPGGAAGTKDTERERTTWLAEEEETWGAEDDAIGQALGAPAAADSVDETETETGREMWLAEDREVWTGGVESVSGTIGEAPPQRDETNTEALLDKSEETDILDPERLQELLDVITAPEEETPRGSKNTVGTSPGLLDDLSSEEVNDIDRFLNG